MKIVKVGYHCCVRLIKEAIALAPTHEIHLIGFKKPNCDVEYFRTFALCKVVSQLEAMVKLHQADTDIFHVHNEPNWMVAAVRKITDKPIILDVHDSMEYRSDKIEHKSAIERLAFDLVDGFVFPSVKCAEITFKSYPQYQQKPHCILPPYVNQKYYKLMDWQWIGGLVYEGRADTAETPEFMKYADLKDLTHELKIAGIPFHIHSTRSDPEFLKYYEEALVENPFPYSSLIKVMGHYDWGFCGNLKPFREWAVSMPNKLFEYMAGGIPVIAMNCELVEQFVTKHGVGIAVKSIAELKERWLTERAACQANVIKKRFDFTMEKHIHVLKDLYNKIKT